MCIATYGVEEIPDDFSSRDYSRAWNIQKGKQEVGFHQSEYEGPSDVEWERLLQKYE